MKKKYIKAEIRTFETQTCHLLADSPTKQIPFTDGSFPSKVRAEKVWDDEEEW